jgi:hypothetical protein
MMFWRRNVLLKRSRINENASYCMFLYEDTHDLKMPIKAQSLRF